MVLNDLDHISWIKNITVLLSVLNIGKPIERTAIPVFFF